MSHQRRAYIRALAYVEPRTRIRRCDGNAYLRAKCEAARKRIRDDAYLRGYGSGLGATAWTMWASLRLAIALDLQQPGQR